MISFVIYGAMNDYAVLKSRITLYRRIWLGIVCLMLLVRFTVMRRVTNERAIFVLIIGYMLTTWLPIMALNVTEGRRLMEYLKDNHYEKWEEMTYVPGLGSGLTNSLRSLPFIRSKDDLGDPEVMRLKQNYRSIRKLALTVFYTYPLVFIMVILPGVS